MGDSRSRIGKWGGAPAPIEGIKKKRSKAGKQDGCVASYARRQTFGGKQMHAVKELNSPTIEEQALQGQGGGQDKRDGH